VARRARCERDAFASKGGAFARVGPPRGTFCVSASYLKHAESVPMERRVLHAEGLVGLGWRQGGHGRGGARVGCGGRGRQRCEWAASWRNRSRAREKGGAVCGGTHAHHGGPKHQREGSTQSRGRRRHAGYALVCVEVRGVPVLGLSQCEGKGKRKKRGGPLWASLSCSLPRGPYTRIRQAPTPRVCARPLARCPALPLPDRATPQNKDLATGPFFSPQGALPPQTR